MNVSGKLVGTYVNKKQTRVNMKQRLISRDYQAECISINFRQEIYSDTKKMMLIK